MAHLKRLTAPESWGIHKKVNQWVTRPSPGPHRLADSIPISLLLKSLLAQAKTTREAKQIILAGKILVDGIARKDHRFSLGLMDILSLPDAAKSYILLLDTYGKFKLYPAKHKASKYCKILGKTTLKGKKTQLNLSSGRNMIIDKDSYKVGDTVMLDLSLNKIKSHLKFEKDATAYITAGKYTGNICKIVEINKLKLSKDKITIKIGSHSYETLKDYAFVVDEGFLEDERNKSDEKHKD